MTVDRDAPGVPAPGRSDARVEVLYQSERTRVTRRTAAGGRERLIRKEPLGADALQRARHELRVLRRLDQTPGVVRLAPGSGPDELLLRDDRGVCLAALLDREATGSDPGPDPGPGLRPGLVPSDVVAFAAELAGVVAGVHRAGVVHLDLTPTNILAVPRLDGPPAPVLIDFHLSAVLADDVLDLSRQFSALGTLPYAAPEQTGRTATRLDERADLYGLGAVLYELVTGEPPFPVGDPLEMLRDVLTRPVVPPIERAPQMSPQLSDIILRLLEKDPDARYQSADGLASDLARLRDRLAAGEPDRFPLGERDFPRRLHAPTRQVGRDSERAVLHAAFERALDGGERAVLVRGPRGVGKTALVDTLRPAVAARGGWFVAGGFAPDRRDLAASGIVQVLRAIGRFLLAGAEEEVDRAQARIREAVGVNVDLLADLPEFAVLLRCQAPASGPPAQVVDDATSAARRQQAVLDMLNAVASPQHPLVVVLEDLQWAGTGAVTWLEDIRSDERLAGLLVVGVYRDDEVGPEHPLAGAVRTWQAQERTPEIVSLGNLDQEGLATMLAEMLRLSVPQATPLARAVAERTSGNPLDSVELVHALRQAEELRLRDEGWTWDAAAIRRFIGGTDVLELVTARIARLSPASRQVVDALAALGGDVEEEILRVACSLTAEALEERLLPALEEGLAAVEGGERRTVRLRHERVRQAAWARLGEGQRRELHLTLARRLAGTVDGAVLAADQYLRHLESGAPSEGGELAGPKEARAAATLFVSAAARLRILHPNSAERFLDAATRLLGDAGDDPLVREVRRHRHAVRYALGRLAEADEEYRQIERSDPEPQDLLEPLRLQMASLTNRGQPQQAIELGLGLLSRLGLDVPQGEDASAEIVRGLPGFLAWAADLDPTADLARPEPPEPVRVTAEVLDALGAPAHFGHPSFGVWLILAAQRVWAGHGPCGPLTGQLAGAPLLTIPHAGDYRAGYAVSRHMVEIGEARRYQAMTAMARHLFSLLALHWLDPVEEAVAQSRRAREDLRRTGDVQMACFTHYTCTAALFDTAATVASCAAEAETGLAFATRSGNSYAAHSYLVFRQACRAMQGLTTQPGSFDGTGPATAGFDEAAFLAEVVEDPSAAADFHIYRAICAAVFDDRPALVHHAAAARPHLPSIDGYYPRALAELVHGLALVERCRQAAPGHPDAEVVSELEACLRWMRERAADAPANFAHLADWLDAERTWAGGDLLGALRTFDSARRRVAGRVRPWHLALITERAARCHLACGLAQTGGELLQEALRLYLAWGAVGKVRQLTDECAGTGRSGFGGSMGGPATTASSHRVASNALSADQLDLLAVLRTSQALSSETHFDQLRVRVGELIGAMTGATGVLLAVRDDEGRPWTVWPTSGAETSCVPLDEAGHLLPLSAFGYCVRAGEPLLVPDAVRDDRFAADPYLSGLDRCALLIVPIQGTDRVRAALVLENRTSRNAFTTDRIDALQLVIGQLAVSLANVQLYAVLERRVAERTAELAKANRALEALSNTDALTGLPNRRLFDLTLDTEWQRAVRDASPLALAMIDVDRFKQYNDRYGHVAGDDCLRRVASALREGLRDRSDVVCRYGGEEFAVIVPGLDLEGVRSVAERIRGRVAALKIPHADLDGGVVTISVGIAAYRPGGTAGGLTSVEELIEAADAGLYTAKHGGRDQVRSAPPLPAHQHP